MPLFPADEDDLDELAAFVNAAYHGDSSRVGWTTEADLFDGHRTDAAALRASSAAKPGAVMLMLRDNEQAPLLGCVWLEPHDARAWYLGMLAVRPDLQNIGLGKSILTQAEAFARGRGARLMRMRVINLRDTLIAWYRRRGYRLTGETQPFPQGKVLKQPGEELRFVVLEKRL